MTDLTTLSHNARQQLFDKLQAHGLNQPLTTPLHQASASPYKALEHLDKLAQFTRVAAAHRAKIVEVDNLTQLPTAVATALHELAPNSILHLGENIELQQLDWQREKIQTSTALFSDDGAASIAMAVCGIADTGTAILTSSTTNPTRNNFLAAHHFIVVEKSALVSYSEDAWELLRKQFRILPRAINFISGPSSSADVGLKLEYGAHGPKSLTFFLID